MSGCSFSSTFEKLFVTVPLAWLFNALGVELPDPWIKVLAVAAGACFSWPLPFTGCGAGRTARCRASGKWIVWFFVLLPLFLFF